MLFVPANVKRGKFQNGEFRGRQMQMLAIKGERFVYPRKVIPRPHIGDEIARLFFVVVGIEELVA